MVYKVGTRLCETRMSSRNLGPKSLPAYAVFLPATSPLHESAVSVDDDVSAASLVKAEV